jgi:hypothetical protein
VAEEPIAPVQTGRGILSGAPVLFALWGSLSSSTFSTFPYFFLISLRFERFREQSQEHLLLGCSL